MNARLRTSLIRVFASVSMLFLAGCVSDQTPTIVAGRPDSYVPSSSDIEGLPWSKPTARTTTPAPAEARPGLATTAGSENWSPVQQGWFHRKNNAAPDATDSFYYNDETGAKAMMSALGDASRKSGLFPAAGDRLRTGLSVEDDDALPRLENNDQRVVIGHAGEAFGILLKNTTKHRLEIVVSVDGLDVLDGKPASVKKYGYVLDAGQEYTIQGFRKNDKQVKQFVFGSVNHSEAARKGQARNVGVVGLAVYEEDEVAARAAQLSEALQRSGASAFPRN